MNFMHAVFSRKSLLIFPALLLSLGISQAGAATTQAVSHAVKKPTLIVSYPANNSTVTQPNIVAMGQAHENNLVTGVFYQLVNAASPYDAGNFQSASTANGWNNWWANLSPITGTNFLYVFAVDANSHYSTTNKVKFIYSAAVKSVAGLTITVPSEDYFISFAPGTNSSFSERNAVGYYVYAKNGANSGKLVLKYTAPPSATNLDKVNIAFNGPSTGYYSDPDDAAVSGNFNWATATNFALTNLNGAKLALTSTNGNLTLLSFLNPPLVTGLAGSTNLIPTGNPLTLFLSTPYPGNLGDRVAVAFTIYQKNSSGNVTSRTANLLGSVNSTNTANASAGVLLDAPLYLYTKSAAFVLLTNAPLAINTFYYTNYTSADTNVSAALPAGPFSYANFSPVGSLLKITRNGTNEFLVLTFDSTNNSGTYYDEAYAIGTTHQVTDFGTFGIEAPPTISVQPKDTSATNGGIAVFASGAVGSQPITYQWYFNGTNSLADGPTSSGSSISGSTSNVLVITSVTTNDVGTYTLEANNAFGTATSRAAGLTIGIPPQIQTQPTNSVVTASSAATNATVYFNVIATGIPQPTFHWLVGATTNPPFTLLQDTTYNWGHVQGATATTLIINLVTKNPSSTNIGYYSCIVSNSFGVTNSSWAYLNITN
jgi:Immunoglobulin domain